jgi:hypothetical protein
MLASQLVNAWHGDAEGVPLATAWYFSWYAARRDIFGAGCLLVPR